VETIATHSHVRITLKHLDGRCLCRIKDIPVVYSRIGYKTNGGLADPLPKGDILIHLGGLELRLCTEIKDLESSLGGAQGNYLTGPMHDGAISLDWTSRHVVAIFEGDDDNLRLGGLTSLLANTEVVVRFEGLMM